jgi:WD40 repeat protein
MDISADSTLLATGSADKNLKLWGLDFGDCHKSFLAHVVRLHHLSLQQEESLRCGASVGYGDICPVRWD